MTTDDWGTPAAADGWGSTATTSGWGAGGDAGGERKKGCFKCGQEGHNKADCPQPDVKRACFNCGQEGHNKQDCPNPPKARACFKCGEEGHSKADCPNAGEGGGERKRGCFKCGEEGHSKADCPQAGDEKPRGCFRCGEEGHSRAECPKPEICHNCGGEGHQRKDCTVEPTTRVVKDKEGKDVEVYVPKELSADKLYSQSIHTGINFDKFEKIPMTASGDNPPAPIVSFDAAGLRKILLDNIEKTGYLKPTPIQRLAIPAIMAKRDMMSCAQTGSGKTAAFLLPIIHDLLESGCTAQSGDRQSPEAVIIAPTRELASQIKDHARMFCAGSMIQPVVIYGGASTSFQAYNLARGCNILIGTPGRIKDFLARGKLSFEKVKFLVLDEADRLLDMGFSEVIREIVGSGEMPEKGKRVTMMFSATFAQDVQQLASEFLDKYLFIKIGVVGAANKDVKQIIEEVPKFKKREKLVEILKEVGSDRTMVFVETKKNCDFIAIHLNSEGFPATSIHGDRLQRERELALADFKSNKFNILVATNVAARGLDIAGVEHVINYDLPESIDEYVHRIGRTGRVGNVGKSTSFFDPSDEKNAKLAPELVHILTEAQLEVPSFLTQFGGTGAGATSFGASDIRGGAVPAVTDDDW